MGLGCCPWGRVGTEVVSPGAGRGGEGWRAAGVGSVVYKGRPPRQWSDDKNTSYKTKTLVYKDVEVIGPWSVGTG